MCELSKMETSSLYAKGTTGNPSGDAGTVMYYTVKIVYVIQLCCSY